MIYNPKGICPYCNGGRIEEEGQSSLCPDCNGTGLDQAGESITTAKVNHAPSLPPAKTGCTDEEMFIYSYMAPQ